MGSCFSKKKSTHASSSPPPIHTPEKIKPKTQLAKNKIQEVKETVKKEVFIIKHRKSHDLKNSDLIVKNCSNHAPVRTSSCTKEELDAILIQCGRLSRSSSTGKSPAGQESSGGRKYSGSKRSYDFENESLKIDENEVDQRRSEIRHRRSKSPAISRSSSRERTSGGRRLSRSPCRRSDSPTTSLGSNNSNSRPGKMVSVPATVPEPIRRIEVKRNACGEVETGSRNISRSNSRKKEISPYRRNPLNEIDTNIISQSPQNIKANESSAEESKPPYGIPSHVSLNVITSEPLKPQNITRTRSSRLSRDFDTTISPEITNPTSSSSYTALLLEDIQNFHQKNNNTSPPAFSLPTCLTKACSILDEIADLNSTTSSNFTEEERRNNEKPIFESEIVVKKNDLMETSFHKYVTVGRGTKEGEEFDDQESSGSNSFVSNQRNWASSSTSCWEPNSADSTASKGEFMKREVVSDAGKIMGFKKRELGSERAGIGRSRIGSRGGASAST